MTSPTKFDRLPPARPGEWVKSSEAKACMEKRRLNAPYAKEAVTSTLAETDGSYSGTANVLTPCGWKVMTVTAKMD